MRRLNNFVPLTAAGLFNGYPCFVISIAMIGVCTAVIGDVAGHLGCFIYLKDSVNAIAFVALGTSVPGIEIVVWKSCETPFWAAATLTATRMATAGRVVGWLIVWAAWEARWSYYLTGRKWASVTFFWKGVSRCMWLVDEGYYKQLHLAKLIIVGFHRTTMKEK